MVGRIIPEAAVKPEETRGGFKLGGRQPNTGIAPTRSNAHSSTVAASPGVKLSSDGIVFVLPRKWFGVRLVLGALILVCTIGLRYQPLGVAEQHLALLMLPLQADIDMEGGRELSLQDHSLSFLISNHTNKLRIQSQHNTSSFPI